MSRDECENRPNEKSTSYHHIIISYHIINIIISHAIFNSSSRFIHRSLLPPLSLHPSSPSSPFHASLVFPSLPSLPFSSLCMRIRCYAPCESAMRYHISSCSHVPFSTLARCENVGLVIISSSHPPISALPAIAFLLRKWVARRKDSREWEESKMRMYRKKTFRASVAFSLPLSLSLLPQLHVRFLTIYGVRIRLSPGNLIPPIIPYLTLGQMSPSILNPTP
ncbi:hypothetical protein EYC84_005699 [Monilinia fructicola]|uniref:Uncharacterized protein n=1 Tax=Monilinia fructicola TaxID=38448 RepID=A0A5M9K5V5_MONFR|nr:hypothetical protein EYC84_005699 [Monilinia fructicola]